MNIQEFREKFPQYDKIPDTDLAVRLKEKFYPAMSQTEFNTKFLGEQAKPEAPKPGWTSQFERMGQIYTEEVESGLSKMKEFYRRPRGKQIAPAIGGALQYGLSPLTAVAKGAFGEPVEQGVKALGAPESVSKFAGATAEQIPYFLPYGKLVSMAGKALPEAKVVAEAQKIGPKITRDIQAGSKKPLQFPVEPSPELAAEMTAAGKLSKPVIEEGLQKQVADAVVESVRANPTPQNKRIGQSVVDLIAHREMQWQDLPGILKKYDITPEEFAIRLKDTYSTAGRSLQRLSVAARKTRELIKDNPEAQKVLDKVVKELPEPGGWDKAWNTLYNIESTRRGFLVTQLATGARNALSQTGRAIVGAADEAIQGAIRATIGGEGNILKQMGQGLDTFIAFANRLSPKARKHFADLMGSENASFAKIKLFSAAVHEVTAGRTVANLLNTPNRFQEYFFRKIATEAKLMQLIERKGLNYKNIKPEQITQKMWEQAVDYGLEATFAAMPKSKFGQTIVRQWAGNPLMTALLNPFPRFAFGNALPYMINYSPISLMKAMNPKVVAELASGNPDKFASLASKGLMGSMMLGWAMWYRNQPDAPGKYYHIASGENDVIDLRAFAPLATPYLLLAEAMSAPERLSAADWMQAAIGLNRVAGTGLVATDIIRGKKLENSMQVIGRLAGEYAGSFTVPVRTFQDFYAGMDPEEAKIRDVRERQLMGPVMRNIPVVSQSLPESAHPLKAEPPRAEHPIARQLTGLSRKTQNMLEKEVDRLAIDTTRIYPRTGVPEADRELSKIMGPIAERTMPKILTNPEYKKLSDPMKRLVWSEYMTQLRTAARGVLQQQNPELFLQIKYEGLAEDVIDILESRGIKLPRRNP
uniref:Uncharacterized protein n=1 Tax=viral metagenome TaxID=1070528 RepID=A0A6H1Z974_9ZZZZ